MAEVIEITDLSLDALRPYKNTNELQLVRWFEPEKEGIFIAESPKVIRRALAAGYRPLSFLLERKYIEGQASDIIAEQSVPVYTAASEVLAEITGFKLTQGALCAMRRKPLPEPAEVLARTERVAVLEDVMNQTNIGAIFRSAAALGFDAVLLTKPCSDPLYRRSVRVSMGTVFQVPWTYFTEDDYLAELKRYGFTTAAMALRHDTVSIDDERLREEKRLAVILGTEGEGLRGSTIAGCDHTIKIPMAHGVDSLNVAAASAVAFWELSKRRS